MVVSLFKHINLLVTLTVGYFRWCEWNGHFIMSNYNFLFLSLWVWDTILGHTREHFSFINYLVSATLLLGDRFEHFLRMHWATPWRPTQCSMEASWRQSSVLQHQRSCSWVWWFLPRCYATSCLRGRLKTVCLQGGCSAVLHDEGRPRSDSG